tara:strand:+ start:720 stop:1322 length:603 start_codon:yes stop_codon:yes gene_type:complete
MNEGSELEGKVIECKFCNEKWLYESQTKYLENRLIELNSDLDETEAKINLRKKDYQDNIDKLENDLKTKKDELDTQKILQDKVTAFENRLKDTEKLNSEGLKLNDKISKIKKEIRTTSENISSSNKDIEEKTNYLESRVNSYNENNAQDNQFRDFKPEVRNNDVVNIKNHFNQSKEQDKDEIEDNKKNKRSKFFSPNFLK